MIRHSANQRVPHGRPNVMFHAPELYGATDKLCLLAADDIRHCEQNVIKRTTIACDEDIHGAAIMIMAQRNLQVPLNAFEAVDLYVTLKNAIFDLVL